MCVLGIHRRRRQATPGLIGMTCMQTPAPPHQSGSIAANTRVNSFVIGVGHAALLLVCDSNDGTTASLICQILLARVN